MSINVANVIYDGIAAYSDRYAISRNNELFFLSLYGSSQSVYAIGSAACTYYSIHLQTSGAPAEKLDRSAILFDEKNYVLASRSHRYGSTVNMKTVRTSWGRAHTIWYDSRCNLKASEDEIIVIGKDPAEAELRFMDTLDSRPIPLLPTWKHLLIEKLETVGILEPLISFGCTAYLLRYMEDEILQIISEGISNKTFTLSEGVD